MFRTSAPGRGGGVQCCARFISNKISLFALKFFTFWHHSITDKTEVQNIFYILYLIFPCIKRFSRIQLCRQERTVSLLVFGKNASFHSAYSPKMRNSASTLNTLYIAESAQFYAAFRR
jgi:hypothetical protein